MPSQIYYVAMYCNMLQNNMQYDVDLYCCIPNNELVSSPWYVNYVHLTPFADIKL